MVIKRSKKSCWLSFYSTVNKDAFVGKIEKRDKKEQWTKGRFYTVPNVKGEAYSLNANRLKDILLILAAMAINLIF